MTTSTLTQQPLTPAAPETAWHALDTREVRTQLRVDPDSGLTPEDAAERLLAGRNELVEKPLTSPLAILWEQLTGPLVLLLIAAAVISGFLGKWDSTIAISAIVVLNAILGVVQEYRAEQAMAALKKMAAPLVRVKRGGKLLDVQSPEIVAGDVILVEAGSIIPADSRLVESANLSVMESSLTGESAPVEKNPGTLDEANVPLGDRHNMLYMGTSVTYGRGTAIVVETGMKTQLGKIADALQSVENEDTPLQRRMEEVGKVLLIGAVIVMIIAFIIGIVVGDPIEETLLNAVAIAVAVVPEGLPAVVTVALALGAQRMLKRRALIRKLPAVETLGSVTVICSDKTGTLTENRMTVTLVDVGENRSTIHEIIEGGKDRLLSDDPATMPSNAQAIVLVGDSLCNDAVLERRGLEASDLAAVGDPTEGALVIAAAKFGFYKNDLEEVLPRIGEVPFSSERKRMTTVHNLDERVAISAEERKVLDLLQVKQGEYLAFTKGAPDTLLEVCTHVWLSDQIEPLTPELLKRIDGANNHLAQEGLRVLGLAFRKWSVLPQQWTPEAVEKELVFVGMVGIIDPPRAEVRDAVAICKQAGIRPVMITGDHPLTALNIAKQLGIAKEGDRVLTGYELTKMSQTELEAVVDNVPVYARVSPENKLNIVKALQTRGNVTAMTGDGVNDAPALKRADIGVAMGITGTAVSKEASDMVLTDDNFATIVSAVEEGRTIYENIRRFVKYLLASNTGELIVLLFTQIIPGMTIPLSTLQILWMNLITDGVPALALGVERGEPGGMKRAPYPPTESIFGRGMGRHILIVGLTMGIVGLALGYWALQNAQNKVPDFQPNTWKTMVFIFLTLAQMGHAIALRSHKETIFKLGLGGNRLLLGAVITTVTIQIGVVYIPFFNDPKIFGTVPLTMGQLALCLVLSTVVFWVVEFEKLLMRRGVLSS